MSDIFRPRTEPARRIYNAFQDEAANRKGRSFEVWSRKERDRVWYEAREYALDHNKPIISMEQIEEEERSACGHIDYGYKWASRVAEILTK